MESDMATAKTVFVVDDLVSNLMMAQNALAPDIKVLTMVSGAKLFTMLEKLQPDLILLDIQMPEMDGFEVLTRLKQHEQWRNIPVIFLTAELNPDSEDHGLEMGAIDFIHKPFSANVLRRRINIQLQTDKMVKEVRASVRNIQNAMISVIAELIESRDLITGAHVERTKNYVEILIQQMKKDGVYLEALSSWDLPLLIASVQMHDLGKIKVSDTILNKPGKLGPEEFKIIQTHTLEGVRIIDNIALKTHDDGYLKYAKLFAGYHHEKWNGTGYPYGLFGEDIPLQGRIMAIADVYDALITERPYKRPIPHDQAVAIIKEGSGTHFDPLLVNVFKKVADDFWVQSVVDTLC
jgi:putative two-component system response regulator